MASDSATAPIVLRCLGTFEVTVYMQPVAAFPTDKIRGLLAYLALESHTELGARGSRPHRREALAGLFWPEMVNSLALSNLRLALHRLRQALDRAAPGANDALLTITRQTVQLNHAALTTDVRIFQELLATCAAHAHADLSRCDECLERLAQAVGRYDGELLAGFGLADAPAFEEWLLLRREMLHQQALTAVHALIAAYEQRGDYHQAHLYARRQLALDPWRETAHRQLMRVLARLGLHDEALAQYETCRRMLRQELAVEPDAETVALYEQIRAGASFEFKVLSFELRAPQLKTQNSELKTPLPDWGDAPETAQLYGRARELALLERWLVQDRSRVIVLLGIGGVGKTTLATAAVEAVAQQFDTLIWRSLLNAPPLDELLRDVLQALARQRLIDIPTRLDAQLALLIDGLRQQRCLLVLDNLESILEADQPGQMRPGYAGYAQLIQLIAERRHQSCLLLTSRERPQGMERWENGAPQVCTLQLAGIDAAAGQAMLTARGLVGADVDAIALVTRYSGNPLALKLVAQSVQDLFGNDIASFLATEAPIFDDIRSVLDQQFARLSSLEREILIWLAIEREPIPIPALRDNLVNPGSSRTFLEALHGLRRRSLIEQSALGCALQNVVTEYLTDVLIEQICREIVGDRGQASSIKHQASSITPSPLHPFILSGLNRYALLKATAKEYVRASQMRLIVQPIAQQLAAALGGPRLIERLRQILAELHEHAEFAPGYAAGNILNLLLHLGVDVQGYDFSRLNVWQAYMQGAHLPRVNFHAANLAHSVFTHMFGEIMAISFDSQGQLLLAGLAAGVLCVWQAADGQLLREYQSFDAGVQVAAFSADGRLLVSANTDHKVRVWDVVSGRRLHILSGHAATPWSLMFSPDALLLATGGVDGIVHIWDVPTGQLRQTFHGHTRAVVALTFTRDRQILASGDIDGAICVWQLGHPAPLHTLQGHDEEVHGLVFDATGTILASGSYDYTIRLWDIRSGQVAHILQAHTQMVRALAISADGSTLASGGQDTFVCLWDLRSGQALGTLFGSMYATANLAFSADNQLLATVGADHTVYLWHAATSQRLDTLHSYNNHIYSVDFSPDGQLIASGGADCGIALWDRASGRLVRTLQGHTRAIYCVAFSPDGATLASAGHESSIRLWDIHSGRTIRVLAGHTDDVESIQFSPDGQLLISASRDRTLRVWDVRSGQTLHTLHGHTDQVRACVLSPDGHLLASGSHDRTVRIWDLRSAGGQLLHTLHGHTNSIKSVSFSPDGRFVASCGHDQTIRVWDAQLGRALYTLTAQTLFSVAFHPAGELLAVSSANHTVQLWDIAPNDQRVPSERKLLSTLRGHTDLVECVRFSPDGRWLASGSADETIRLWDVATGECLYTLRADGPYAGMNIADVTGISPAQKAALKALGAVEGD